MKRVLRAKPSFGARSKMSGRMAAASRSDQAVSTPLQSLWRGMRSFSRRRTSAPPRASQ